MSSLVYSLSMLTLSLCKFLYVHVEVGFFLLTEPDRLKWTATVKDLKCLHNNKEQ